MLLISTPVHEAKRRPILSFRVCLGKDKQSSHFKEHCSLLCFLQRSSAPPNITRGFPQLSLCTLNLDSLFSAKQLKTCLTSKHAYGSLSRAIKHMFKQLNKSRWTKASIFESWGTIVHINTHIILFPNQVHAWSLKRHTNTTPSSPANSV